MQNAQFMNGCNESQVTEIIFDACRANESRSARIVKGHRVSFTLLITGEHEVCVRNPVGMVIALANVDSCDI